MSQSSNLLMFPVKSSMLSYVWIGVHVYAKSSGWSRGWQMPDLRGSAKFANAPGLTNAPQLPGESRAHLELTDSLIVVTRFCKKNLPCFNGRPLLNVLAVGKVNIQTSYSVLKTVLTQLRYLLIRHDSHSLMADSNKNINSQLFYTAALS